MTWWFKSLILISLTFSTGRLDASEMRYKYEPHVVSLTGVLSSRVYPGPPEYESVKKGDKPQGIWLIKLPKPISVEADEATLINEKETGIKEVQIVIDSRKDSQFFKKNLGKSFRFTGTLFHAHTIHHRLNLLLDVQSYRLVK